MSEGVEMELELLEAAYGPDFALLRENSCEVKLNKDFTVRLIFPESYPASIFVADFRSVHLCYRFIESRPLRKTG